MRHDARVRAQPSGCRRGGWRIDVASMGVFDQVGSFLGNIIAGMDTISSFVTETATHGVVGGALNAAQGGDFLEGFASGAVGKAKGRLASGGPFGRAGDGNFASLAMRTTVGAIGRCAGAVLGGRKCGKGAATPSLAHLFNAERPLKHEAAGGHAIKLHVAKSESQLRAFLQPFRLRTI